MKTLVIPRHAEGPAENGFDSCYARTGYGGKCPGVQHAEWLNSLGEDDELYGTHPVKDGVTNGEVRQNWLKNSHILPKDETVAQLKREQIRLRRDLQRVTRKLAQAVKRA